MSKKKEEKRLQQSRYIIEVVRVHEDTERLKEIREKTIKALEDTGLFKKIYFETRSTMYVDEIVTIQ
jgi:hypothetical protein